MLLWEKVPVALVFNGLCYATRNNHEKNSNFRGNEIEYPSFENFEDSLRETNINLPLAQRFFGSASESDCKLNVKVT